MFVADHRQWETVSVLYVSKKNLLIQASGLFATCLSFKNWPEQLFVIADGMIPILCVIL